MRKCNVCNKRKPGFLFANKNKKTCRMCERTWINYYLRLLVHQRQLTPVERLGNRLGYMGTAFIMMSPYLLKYDNLGAYTYQVWIAKQWNLVIVNLNLLVGYGLFIFRL